ncbi:MAG: acyl-CoA dehydrogenase family protein [Alphaproteobacteria bacterium]
MATVNPGATWYYHSEGFGMDIDFDDDIRRFRQEIRDFIRANLPDSLRRMVRDERVFLTPADIRPWTRMLFERGGWNCPSWPRQHGGPGWTYEQQYVFERELADNDAPQLDVFAAGMVGPAIIEFGTEDQKRRFLPGLACGDIILCQGYSEPNAGSDLASLQCRAVREGGEYVIDGTKMWTSDAQYADYMFGLFRTDSSGKKQHGITVLLVDMNSPGLTLRPIRTFEGGDELSQTFFDTVRVPLENRLGDEHMGWNIAKYILGMERFGTAEVGRSSASLCRLKTIASEEPAYGKRLIDDADFARDIAKAEIALRELELTEQRFLFGPGGADAMGFEASLLKIKGTELQQHILGLMVEAIGYYANVAIADSPDAGGNEARPGPDTSVFAARAFFNMRKTTIYSGSNEIQKNIIAKAVLGL